MKEYTENELKSKAEAYCSAVERCPSEVIAKLRQWGAPEEVAERILASLGKDRYIDSNRYCRAFVRDKYRFNQWGRTKIVQALRLKRLTPEEIEEGLREIEEDEYQDILCNLLKQKARSVKAATPYERNAKLMRYAVGKGFTIDEVRKQLKQNLPDEFVD